MNYINEEVSNCFSYRKRTINGYLNSFYNHSEKIIYDYINQIKKDVKNTLSSFSTSQTKKYTRYINMTGADSHYDRVPFYHKNDFYTPIIYVASVIADFFTNYKPVHEKIVQDFKNDVNYNISDFLKVSINNLYVNKSYLIEHLKSKYKFFKDKFDGIKQNKEKFKKDLNEMNDYLLAFEKFLED